MKYQLNLGSGEMYILRYVAEQSPVTVREVANHVAETKGHVRTTVLNVMDRLRKKGFLKRVKRGGVYKYAPVKPKRELFQGLLKDFVDAAFGGSHDPLVGYLTGEVKVTKAELKMLRCLAKKLEDRKDRK